MPTQQADVYGRKIVTINKPITADMALVDWSGSAVAGLTNVTIVYQQGVIRRRTIGGRGNPVAVVYTTQPAGTLSAQRLVASPEDDIFSLPGWNICLGTATLTISFNGATALTGCDVLGAEYVLTGAVVSNYTTNFEAESLTVVDGVTIEFLQMERRAGTTA